MAAHCAAPQDPKDAESAKRRPHGPSDVGFRRDFEHLVNNGRQEGGKTKKKKKLIEREKLLKNSSDEVTAILLFSLLTDEAVGRHPQTGNGKQPDF